MSVDFSCLTTIQSHNLNSITRSHTIDIVIITQDVHWGRSLALRHILGKLLYLHKLFISKTTVFMHDLESFLKFTIWAVFRLLDFCIDKVNRYFRFAFETLEHGGFHFGVNFTASYDNSSERYQPVDMFLLKATHQRNFR